jgi:hypothetical protein
VNQDDRHPPGDEGEPEEGRESSAFERHRAQRSDQPANADRRGQVAHFCCAAVQDPENGDDDQNVQAAADERLRNGQPDEQSSVGGARDRAETRADDLQRAQVAGFGCEVDPSLDPDPAQQECRCEERSGADDEDDAGVGERDERGRQDRSHERSDALDRRRCTVRRDQFFGRSCE